jgi:hypothetical protein
MTAAPASSTKSLVDQGTKSESVLSNQIDYWTAKAAAYLAAFTDAVAVTDADAGRGRPVRRVLRADVTEARLMRAAR